ncbi:MAG: DUF3810 family protein [Gemmatimonadetes bacterium]|nr:DUF3810 family protein [Gemmatimonadota bacterium]
MQTIRIPNEATYSPVSLTDIAIAAPLLSRIVLGTTLPGLALQTAAMVVYAGSAAQDWYQRLGVRRIDFMREFGADVRHLPALPRAAREAEMRILAERINDGYTEDRLGLSELAGRVDDHLIDFMAGITDQRIETSREVRDFSLARLIFPFALGAADIFSGDIAIFHDTGVFAPHIVAHEFAHRKGYYRELDAQALAYLALCASGEPMMVQSALCERLHRNVRVVAGDDEAAFDRIVQDLDLREELEAQFMHLRPSLGPLGRPIADAMRTLYDLRMRATGQNGIADYDEGFTRFLHAFETSARARQRPPAAGRVHGG